MSRVKITAQQAKALGLEVPAVKKRKPKSTVSDEHRNRMFVEACKAHRLPKPEIEFRFAPPRFWRFDFAWQLLHGRYALECQGGLFSQGRHVRGPALVAEHEKLNEAAILGWFVLFCTPKQIDDGSIFPVLRRAIFGD